MGNAAKSDSLDQVQGPLLCAALGDGLTRGVGFLQDFYALHGLLSKLLIPEEV